jgi:hypothetical protein
MGLGGITFIKRMLRDRNGRFFHKVMRRASYSPERMDERPVGERTRGKGVEAGFDVAIVELMLRKYSILKRCYSTEQFAERWRDLVPEQVDRFPDATTLVFLFDDETNVPKAKGETQRKRRAGKGSGFTAEEQIALGPYRYLCNNDPKGFNARIKCLFEAEAMEREHAGRTSVTPFEVYMTKHMHTSGLREDEFEFATRCIAAAPYVTLGGHTPKRIIIDRGVWCPSYERGDPASDPHGGHYEPWLESVYPSFPALADLPPIPEEVYRRAYDDVAAELKECSTAPDAADRVSCLKRLLHIALQAWEVHNVYFGGVLSHLNDAPLAADPVVSSLRAIYEKRSTTVAASALCSMVGDDDSGGTGTTERPSAERAWILMDGKGVRKIDEMDDAYIIGEADLKIPHYVRLFAGRSVFVVCHDTDLLIILLMTVKDWLRPQGRCPGRIMLDMTTASDTRKRPSLHGVVDIIALWREIHHWFASDFRGVRNPVEVFCLMIIMMGTDYVNNPPMLGEKLLWKAFSEKALYSHLAHAVATDGHMGAALPLDTDHGVGADDDVVRVLKRDLRSGTFFDRDQPRLGLANCPRDHQMPFIEVYEGAVTMFMTQAYAAVKGNLAEKWPSREWMAAQARRIAWQMAYWYQGDTLEGRILDDEMALDDGDGEGEQGQSLYGWHWVPDSGSREKASKKQASVARKRKPGCLGRTLPPGHISEPAPTVVSVERFREIRARKRQRRLAEQQNL